MNLAHHDRKQGCPACGAALDSRAESYIICSRCVNIWDTQRNIRDEESSSGGGTHIFRPDSPDLDLKP